MTHTTDATAHLTEDEIDALPRAERMLARRARAERRAAAARWAWDVAGTSDDSGGALTHPAMRDALPHGLVRRLAAGQYPSELLHDDSRG